MSEASGEKQYVPMVEWVEEHGHEKLGLMSSWAFHDDPKRLAFTFSRYKFVAKMLAGCENVLEVGCGDAFVSRVVRQSVKRLTGVDFDGKFIEDAKQHLRSNWDMTLFTHDMLKGPVEGEFDGIYSMDVLEHIERSDEELFLKNTIAPLTVHGTLIIGMPSLESQTHASPQSKEGHVNCKSQPDFRRLMKSFFHNVYMFSMNDEVVHTGYHAMSHYNIALCAGKKS